MTDIINRLSDIYSIFPQVDIPDEGLYKYIFIQVSIKPEYTTGDLPQTEKTLIFVRGSKILDGFTAIQDIFIKNLMRCEFYLTNIDAELSTKTTDIKCIGGGRIDHSKENQNIFLWGESRKYGQADHKLVSKILQKQLNYPEYDLHYVM